MTMIPALKKLLWLMMPLLVAACGSTPASRFYLLTPLGEPAAVQTLAGEPHIGVGPISFPKYLDRPQIITRSSNAEVYLAETDRWAEPLQENFTRVLAENLSRQLGTGHISIEPSRHRNEIDYRVTAEVIQFDADQNGAVMLLAYWSILDRDGTNLTSMQKSEIHLPTARSDDRAETVRQLSNAIAELGREVSARLSQLSNEPAR
jgi:uncharacterized lipoprotein YmbA